MCCIRQTTTISRLRLGTSLENTFGRFSENCQHILFIILRSGRLIKRDILKYSMSFQNVIQPGRAAKAMGMNKIYLRRKINKVYNPDLRKTQRFLLLH